MTDTPDDYRHLTAQERFERFQRYMGTDGPNPFRLAYIRHAGDPTGPLPTITPRPAHVEELVRAASQHREKAIRDALIAAGQDPEVYEDIARRAAAGEFDLPIDVRISE